MRLMTIWSIPCMSTMERLRRTRDWAAWKAVGAIPKRVRYATTLREIAKVTTMDKNSNKAVPDFKMTDILKDLDAPKSFS